MIKRRQFVSEAVRNKPVTVIAGIGPIYGELLSGVGYNRASNLVGLYLLKDGNRCEFKKFLSEACGANGKHANAAYACVQEYVNNFM